MERILRDIIIFYVVTYLWSLLNAVLTILFGQLFGGKIGSFSIFCFVCQNENGAYKWKRKTFSALPVATITGERIMEDKIQRTKWEITQTIVMTAICEACAVYFLMHYEPISILGFAGILSGILGIWCMGETSVTVYHRFGNSATARWLRAEEEYLMQTMQGRRPRDISGFMEESVQPSTSILFGERKYRYVAFQYYRALDRKDPVEMKRTIYSIEAALRKTRGKQLYSMAPYYAECVFYYCFVENFPERATYYYHHCPASIEKDMDLNGRRIYAYYLYYVKKAPEAALQAIREGLEVADAFSMKGHIPLEKELLYVLQNIITNRQANENEGRMRI